ncbi:hypothetical protein FHX52_4758 [Humibacillus xanthopallidus]|uniref:Uncharacterized protein n=1 Tax=Humibacillus xanthopallidus TaxID=412689 RepID=A0A543PN58_9MICO|nr:hypothetical protein [Humibacillus xanthopallidus]TQN45518.1 hypothetical protein FHX52_4758 [Humibacillus xanthopallidus]
MAGIPWTGPLRAGEVASVPTSAGPVVPEMGTPSPDDSPSARPPMPYAVSPVRGHRPGLMGVAVGVSVVSLALSVLAPMATIVLGLVFFGVLSATLSSRYLLGRFAALLDPAFTRVLVVLVTGVALSGLLARIVGRPAELVAITLGYGVLAAGVWRWPGTTRRVVAWAVLAAALALSLGFPAYHLVVLGHLLALTPLGFLWEWSRGMPEARGRRRFRGALLIGYLGVPALLLSGALDRWLSMSPGQVRSVVGDGGAILHLTTLPGTAGTPLVARLLAVSAFLGTLGYAAWIVFFPRVAPEATQAVEERLPWATAPRVWAGAFTAGAGLAVVFTLNFARAAAVLGAISAYPVLFGAALLVVLAGSGRREKVLPGGPESTYGARTEPEGR